MNRNTKKKKRVKQPKIHLIFDEKEREDYLTGFQKRNLDRKIKRKEALDVMLKDEKKRIKKSQKEALENAIKSQRGIPPELQHLIEPVTYDLPDHTVTVSQISNIDSIHASTTIDLDKTLPSTCVEEMQLKETEEEVDKLRQQIKDLKAKRLKTLKKSKVQTAAKNMQRKKDKQKAWKLRRLFQKGVKHTKKSHKKKKR